MVPSDRGLVSSDYDEYSASSTRSAIYCRLVTIIFMVLLVLRQTLPLMIGGSGRYSFTLFLMLMLRTAGILLPVFVMARALTAFQRRRHRQVTRDIPISSSDGERVQSHSLQLMQPQPHLIRVH
ncbi:hypothetical protein COCNU_02G005630 [Cocos nucifera]|uniref:Uncharacterized protein n=1 Tax=Cocos nucifera TaxID=13894 RepID=A0A8K0HYQ2_COCNU|nr:hypothetical protein COCNU_02G005630 [Cocos nucifera]